MFIELLSKDDRYDLFNIFDLLPGNYQEKAKLLKVNRSALYQYRNKSLTFSDEKVVLLFKILIGNEDFKKLLKSIVSREKIKITKLENCLKLGLFDYNFFLIDEIYQEFEKHKKILDEEREKGKRKLRTQYKVGKNLNIDLWRKLFHELDISNSGGEVFIDDGLEIWIRTYPFWKKIADMVGFRGKLTWRIVPEWDTWDDFWGFIRESHKEKVGRLNQIENYIYQSVILDDVYNSKLSDVCEPLRQQLHLSHYDFQELMFLYGLIIDEKELVREDNIIKFIEIMKKPPFREEGEKF